MIIPSPNANKLPIIVHAIIKFNSVIIPSPGFEPRKRDPKSPVLPLHHEGGYLAAILVHDDSRCSSDIDAPHRSILRNV